MTFDPLINRLAEDLKPVRRRSARVDALIMAIICTAELALFFLVGAARPDMPTMMQQPTFWWRLASLGLIALISGGLAIFSFNPTYSPRKGIRWLVIVIAICLVAGLFLEAGQDGFSSILGRLHWKSGLQCTYKMVSLSIPPVIGLGILMRRGAPTDTRATALLIGLGAAAWGAFVFVFACPFNDPVYIAVWYSVGCGIVTLFSRVALPRLARW
jgi:hypothetical protein